MVEFNCLLPFQKAACCPKNYDRVLIQWRFNICSRHFLTRFYSFHSYFIRSYNVEGSALFSVAQTVFQRLLFISLFKEMTVCDTNVMSAFLIRPFIMMFNFILNYLIFTFIYLCIITLFVPCSFALFLLWYKHKQLLGCTFFCITIPLSYLTNNFTQTKLNFYWKGRKKCIKKL